jgi:GNAT superfamily N-acetyltransferase
MDMNLVASISHRLGASERDALEKHFLALGSEDRRLRFGSPLGDEGVRAYVARIEFERDEVFVVRDAELAIIGAAHVAFGDGACELGLSVLPEARAQGIGNALFERAVMHLRNRGVEKVFVHCLSENEAMKHLARKHGMRLAYEGGESDASMRLPPATPETVLAEWVQDQHAGAVHALRRNALVTRRLLAFLTPGSH